ncbi:MAG: type I secretion system permease/ATPase [Pseudomonadota bacterium]
MKNKDSDNPLLVAVKACRKTFYYIFLYSLATNLLMLALPIFSLQVLDRVISSGSINTLIMLTILTGIFFIVFGILQVVRSVLLKKIADWLERKLSPSIVKDTIVSSCTGTSHQGSQGLRDLGTVKAFLTGPGISAIFDLPWSVIYLIVIWAIHPVNGIIALIGAVLLLIFAILNEFFTKDALEKANSENIQNMKLIDIASRNAEVIEAMGMTQQIIDNFKLNNNKVNAAQSVAGSRGVIISTTSKVFRMFLQIAILASGAYFALNNQMSIGGIIASSILMGRILAPFDAAIASWGSAINSRQSYNKLKDSLGNGVDRTESFPLDEPEGKLSAEGVLYIIPGQKKPILKNINFVISPGEIVGIVGPSAAGKSTLAKLIVGIWKPQNGAIRLDEADVYTWNRKQFGEFVGYLPQDVELFDGSIKYNIARMNADHKPEDIINAGKLAGAHNMILNFPDGYETDIGIYGSSLSAGQRQRIGLARALYGNPKLVILDEPNANLDHEGENALQNTLQKLKELKVTTIAIVHRPALLAHVDKIMIIKDGTITAFDEKDKIIKSLIPKQR